MVKPKNSGPEMAVLEAAGPRAAITSVRIRFQAPVADLASTGAARPAWAVTRKTGPSGESRISCVYSVFRAGSSTRAKVRRARYPTGRMYEAEWKPLRAEGVPSASTTVLRLAWSGNTTSPVPACRGSSARSACSRARRPGPFEAQFPGAAGSPAGRAADRFVAAGLGFGFGLGSAGGSTLPVRISPSRLKRRPMAAPETAAGFAAASAPGAAWGLAAAFSSRGPRPIGPKANAASSRIFFHACRPCFATPRRRSTSWRVSHRGGRPSASVRGSAPRRAAANRLRASSVDAAAAHAPVGPPSTAPDAARLSSGWSASSFGRSSAMRSTKKLLNLGSSKHASRVSAVPSRNTSASRSASTPRRAATMVRLNSSWAWGSQAWASRTQWHAKAATCAAVFPFAPAPDFSRMRAHCVGPAPKAARALSRRFRSGQDQMVPRRGSRAFRDASASAASSHAAAPSPGAASGRILSQKSGSSTSTPASSPVGTKLTLERAPPTASSGPSANPTSRATLRAKTASRVSAPAPSAAVRHPYAPSRSIRSSSA